MDMGMGDFDGQQSEGMVRMMEWNGGVAGKGRVRERKGLLSSLLFPSSLVTEGTTRDWNKFFMEGWEGAKGVRRCGGSSLERWTEAAVERARRVVNWWLWVLR